MNFDEFLKAVEKTISLNLSPFGFGYVGAGTWRRYVDDQYSIIFIQKHSSDAICCVNLGIHYVFLPKAGIEAPIINNRLDFPECEIKLRLTSDSNKKDQWWSFSEQTSLEISQLINSRAPAIFDSYKLDGGIRNLNVDEVEKGNMGLLSPLTKVRACLFLTRFHDYYGEVDGCIKAGTLGLKVAGMAVGPKKAIREILRRYELKS